MVQLIHLGLTSSLPIDRSAGHDRAQDCWNKRVIELSEQPARFLHAPLEKNLGAWIQVALDEKWLHRFSKQFRTALIPLDTQNGQEQSYFK